MYNTKTNLDEYIPTGPGSAGEAPQADGQEDGPTRRRLRGGILASCALVLTISVAAVITAGGCFDSNEKTINRYLQLLDPHRSLGKKDGKLILGSDELDRLRSEFLKVLAGSSPETARNHIATLQQRFDPRNSSSWLHPEPEEATAVYKEVLTATIAERSHIHRLWNDMPAEVRERNLAIQLAVEEFFDTTSTFLENVTERMTKRVDYVSHRVPEPTPSAADRLRGTLEAYSRELSVSKFFSPGLYRSTRGEDLITPLSRARDAFSTALFETAASTTDEDLTAIPNAIKTIQVNFDRKHAGSLAFKAVSITQGKNSSPTPKLNELHPVAVRTLREVHFLKERLELDHAAHSTNCNDYALSLIENFIASLEQYRQGWVSDLPVAEIQWSWEDILEKLRIRWFLEENVSGWKVTDIGELKQDPEVTDTTPASKLSSQLRGIAATRWAEVLKTLEKKPAYRIQEHRNLLLRAFAFELLRLWAVDYRKASQLRTTALGNATSPSYPVDEDYEGAERSLGKRKYYRKPSRIHIGGDRRGDSQWFDQNTVIKHNEDRMEAVKRVEAAYQRQTDALRNARRSESPKAADLEITYSREETEAIERAGLWHSLQDPSGPGGNPNFLSLLIADLEFQKAARAKIDEFIETKGRREAQIPQINKRLPGPITPID